MNSINLVLLAAALALLMSNVYAQSYICVPGNELEQNPVGQKFANGV